MREFRQNVGGCGNDYQSVNRLRYGDVLDGRVNVGLAAGRLGKHSSDDFFSGQSSEGERSNKLLSGSGHDDLHANAAVLQQADNFGGFVCGNSAADSKGNFHRIVASG